MAKTKKGSKTARRKIAKRRPRVLVANDALERIQGHVSMVMDPCHSRLTPSAYRGQDGFVQRFASTAALVTTTQSCFINLFYPAYNSVYTAAVALPTTAITGPLTYNTAGPGQSFLLTNADAQRAVAACMQVDYTGTELNRQGLLYRGILKSSVFNAPSFTLDQIAAMLGSPMRVPDNTSEVKWIPASVEEEYWASGSTAPESLGDRNVLVTVGLGFTSAVAFQFTHTLIAEWQPNQGLGLAANSPNTADSPAGFEHVKTSLARAGNWWLSAARGVENAYQTAASVYQATRGVRSGIAALALTM